MYSILICGKSDEFNNILKTEINNLNIKYIYKIHIFDSKSSLADAIKIGIKCNLLIVDLEMDAEGECISLFRSGYKDSILACYSQHNIITADILKYNPYRLIIRSADREKIKLEIKELVGEMMSLSYQYIYTHYRSDFIKVRLNEVIYIENAKRGSRVVVDKRNEKVKLGIPFLTNEKLNDLAIKYNELIFIHNSYIINIDNVARVANNNVIMNDNTVLSISRKYRKSFLEEIKKIKYNDFG